MKKIEQYIIWEIFRPLVIISIIFSGLFICFSSARLLADAISESIAFPLIIKLVILKTLIAQEVLIPIALYTAIIVALGRLHRDQEIIVMAASGISEMSIVMAVLKAVIPVAILIGYFTVMVRPWAYTHVYITDAFIYGETNFDKYQAGRFYGDEDSGRVVYLKKKIRETGNLESIFLYLHEKKSSEIVVAKVGEQVRIKGTDFAELHLFDGYMYRINRNNDKDSIVRFSRFVYVPDIEYSIGYKRKMESTFSLINSTAPADIAEIQWRMSRPFATIILALLAVPLSRTAPRQAKTENIFIATGVFAIYYNLNGLAQSWVEQGVIGQYPGVWWLHSIMLLAVLWFLIPGHIRRAARTR